jgi:hypothetical protein
MIEELVDDMMNGQNEEKVRERMEFEKETRKNLIQKAETRKEKDLQEMYKQAVLSDFVYNERWLEQALRFNRLNQEEVRVEEEVFIMKEMPLKIEDLVNIT